MWITVAQLNDLNEIQPKRVVFDGEGYSLYRNGETVYCLRDICSHAEVPLSLGQYDKRQHEAICPQHGARFDIRTGKALSMPAVSPVLSIATRVVDGAIQLDLED